MTRTKTWTKPFGRDGVVSVLDALRDEGIIPADLDLSRITVEPPREQGHGHVATNAAMVLSKQVGMKPRDLADHIVTRLAADPAVASVEVAGPGFINISLMDEVWYRELANMLRAGTVYGNSTLGQGEPANVEFVSVNPTGPMHAGHGRGAVYGDTLAALLEKAGYAVTREYWINDAGAQIDTLSRSLHLRYREALGEDIGEIPEGLYPGDYLIPSAQAIAKADGDKWRDMKESDWLGPFRRFAIDDMMTMIRNDLKMIDIEFDVFTSESSMVETGKVDAALEFLTEKGLIYTGVLEPPKGKTPDDWEPRPQTLFRATQFGDDVDRPLKKSDGSWTYFSTDIAYHLDKYRRGFKTMINVWGADHGGYVKRMTAAVKALTDGEGALDVKLCQMVNLMDGGKQLKMSKRAGNFVTIRDIIDQVGKDVFRFIMVTRKNDAQLDFDLQQVTEQSKDNPVFYVQYAHARVHSVLRHATEIFGADALTPEKLADAPMERLTDSAEMSLIMHLAGWPRLVESAALAHEPHRVAFFLYDLASAFHGLWNMGNDNTDLRFIMADDAELTRARMALIRGVALVIASGLNIFGVEPKEEMR
ncbi:MAG: arginine--tRNA ligase [Alphaproteobacteria bacterium]|nr:arginine--tRNA ligase [Alphaproteobacteria bacterium]